MDRCVYRPAARQHEGVMSTTYTYSWLIPIITWCQQFPWLFTNIVLIKSKLKLESRVIIVAVAMSPCNLGGKYCCHPHPRWRKCKCQFFVGGIVCQLNCIRVASIAWPQCCRWCGVFKAEFLWHTLLYKENGEFYTYNIYPYLTMLVFLLMGSPIWWMFSFCSCRSSLVFWWRDAPLVREIQMWGRRCKQWDSHWF